MCFEMFRFDMNLYGDMKDMSVVFMCPLNSFLLHLTVALGKLMY